MARKQTLDAIIQLYKKLGGNTSEVLGTKTNVNFLGKGKSPELMLDMDINQEALAVLPQSKAVEELTSSVGYAVSGKLNDIQANQLLKNMQKMDEIYFPPDPPANITDMATRTRNLDQEGLMSLRTGDDIPRGVGVQRVPAADVADDLPPVGSRGGPEDIAAPFTGAGLEAIKNVKGSNLIVNDIVNKIYSNAGVTENAQPVVRANAREFLNRVKDLSDEPGNTTLADVMEVDDFKFMTEGGGGGMGDPFLLVQKYFGPKVAAAVARLDGADDIQLFAERLVSVTDDAGRTITDRRFNPDTVDISDFEFADGGRVPYFRGKLVGKALGLAKKAASKASGKQMGYGDIRKYGLEAEDISLLFRNVAMDKSLVGKEKTLYMQRLNQVLKNPDDFPDGIREIQEMLGIGPIGFKGGGLAEILEV